MAMDQRQNGRTADGSPRAATRLAEGSWLDATNRLILKELQADARLSLAELGRRVGLSSPAVADRVQRLERDGVITGYGAVVDPRAVGYALAVVIRIRPAPRQIHKVAELARATPEVVECHRITGEDCFFMKAHVHSVEHLEEIIDRFVVFGQTTTSIVQSSPVPGRGVNLD
ncbi:MAG: Lrp/AsnC family transcriptional regulator [Solirubrobacteraceae bacterium]